MCRIGYKGCTNTRKTTTGTALLINNLERTRA